MTQYAEPAAQRSFQKAKEIEYHLNEQLGLDWDGRPDDVDMWRMHLFLADVEESFSKMLHAPIAHNELKGERSQAIIDVVVKCNNEFAELTEKWNKLRWKVRDAVRKLEKLEYEAARAKEDKEANAAALRKAGRLGF